jgi:uncharacterized protein YrzB (UPF0473 family)
LKITAGKLQTHVTTVKKECSQEDQGMKENQKFNCNLGENGEEAEETTVTLTLDDDTTLECVVINIFKAGEREYIALLPMEGPASEEGEVYLYRYSEDENGQPDLENIQDDDEFEMVSDAFDEMLDAAEYDEIVSEEDLDSI